MRSIDLATGELALSDGSREPLDVASLSLSPIDGALLCRVKRALAVDGLPARFEASAQAELLLAVDEQDGKSVLRLGGAGVPLPDL